MLQQIPRFLSTFAVVVGVYWVYALAAVPFIDPNVSLSNGAEGSRRPGNMPRTTQRYAEQLSELFAEGDWERNSPKILETDQGLLLFQDYQALEDGTMEVKPFTVVFYQRTTAKDGTTGKEEQSRPIVMRAPDGAVLTFDRPLDLARGDVGKLERARLRGAIHIHGRESEPGADDQLFIETRNVHIDQQRVVTRHEVQFRFGPHSGSGRNLTIDLFPPKTSTREDTSPGPALGSVKSLELVHVDRINLQLRGGELFGDDEKSTQPTPSNQPPRESTPVLVTCKGSFQLDFVDNVASFMHQVDVIRMRPDGPSDQLNCQLLEIHFADKTESKSEAVARADPMATDEDELKLGVDKLVAVGHPAKLLAPANQVEVRGHRMEYHFVERLLLLDDPTKVWLRHDGHEVEARRLEYVLAEKGRLGQLRADGPGYLRRSGRTGQQTFTARWKQVLDMRPRDGRHVVSVLDTATIEFEEMGRITSDELYLWLLERPAANDVAASSGKSDVKVLPDKMLAQGNVLLQSPDLHGRTQKLEAWFENVEVGPASPNQPGPDGPTGTTQITSGVRHKTTPSNGKQLDLAGNLIRIKVLRKGKQTSIADVTVAGNVRLREKQPPKPGELPLEVDGDVLQLVPASDKLARIHVMGEPARVAARGMTLTSGQVNLDQAANTMWIDQAGEIVMPGRVKLPGVREATMRTGPSAREFRNMKVTWQGLMQFDGRTIHFENNVDFAGQQFDRDGNTMAMAGQSQVLDVVLQRPINFADPKSTGERVDLHQLFFDRDVVLRSDSFAADRTPTARDEMRVRNLLIDNVTGEIRSEGRGWLRTVRVGNADAAERFGGRTAATPPDDDKRGLTFVRVDFERGIGGNHVRRELSFQGRVQAIYGPVENWSDELSTTDRNGLGERGLALTCDILTLAEMGPMVKNRRALEMLAEGGTHLEGANFEASAERISFAEAKSAIVLEGNSRTNAEIWHQHRVGAPRDHAAARKIRFWRDENRVEVEDAQFLDLSRGIPLKGLPLNR